MWECCVCFLQLKNHKLCSFATSTQCHSSHVLCHECFKKCKSCPLCRYTPKTNINKRNHRII